MFFILKSISVFVEKAKGALKNRNINNSHDTQRYTMISPCKQLVHQRHLQEYFNPFEDQTGVTNDVINEIGLCY